MNDIPERRKEAIRLFQQASRKIPSVETVILFGSMARGDFNEDSDIDILVVWAGEKRRGWKELVGIVNHVLLETGEYISIKLLTPGELKNLRETNNQFIMNVTRDGVRVV